MKKAFLTGIVAMVAETYMVLRLLFIVPILQIYNVIRGDGLDGVQYLKEP